MNKYTKDIKVFHDFDRGALKHIDTYRDFEIFDMPLHWKFGDKKWDSHAYFAAKSHDLYCPSEENLLSIDDCKEFIDSIISDNIVTESKYINGDDIMESKLNACSTFDDIRELLESEDCLEEFYDDIEDIIYECERNCIDYINRRQNVVGTDWKDEFYIQNDYVKQAINKILDFINLGG